MRGAFEELGEADFFAGRDDERQRAEYARLQDARNRHHEERMSEIQVSNAIIESATITSDDHGVLSAWLYLDYGNCGSQGFGGFALYLPKSCSHHAIMSFAGHFIWRCMEIAGVTAWADLPGKTIRAKHEHSRVHAIGHIVKDDWFDPVEDFKREKQTPRGEDDD